MSSPTFRIRLGVPSDVDHIADSNLAMAKETEGLDMDRSVLLKGVAALLASREKGFYLVAETEADSTYAGCLAVTSEWSDWNNGQYWWIQSVFVVQAFRGLGVFRSMFHRVESLALEAGDVYALRLYVERTNEVAMKTYDSLGMLHSHYDMREKRLRK